MNPTSVSLPEPNFATFPVLSLMWACHWSFITKLHVVIADSGSNELITIYHPHTRLPTWLIWPLDDGVAMRCVANNWSEEYVFPSLRAALLTIRRLTRAKKTSVDWETVRSLPPSYP